MAANSIGPFYDEKIPHTIGNQIFSLKCGFGIGYGIGRKYRPIWVSVLDLNQSSGIGHTLGQSRSYYILQSYKCHTVSKSYI